MSDTLSKPVLSDRTQLATDNLRFALQSDQRFAMSPEKLQQLPGSAVMAALNGQHVGVFILAYQDVQDEVLWQQWQVSGEALVLRNGRLIRSEGLPQNLLYTANVQSDPLSCWLRSQPSQRQEKSQQQQTHCANSWYSQQDLELTDGRVRRISTTSEFSLGDQVTVATPLRGDVQTRLLHEKVQTSAGHSWHNRYWFQPATGYVVKSEQQLGLPARSGSKAVTTGQLRLQEGKY